MKFTYHIITALMLTTCLFGTEAFAATIHFEQPSDVVQVGDVVRVAVLLNTEGKTINAVEAEVTYGTEEMVLKEIRDGDSIVNFWVEAPKSTEPGKVRLSGVTPGGITGRDLNLLTLEFETKKEGVGSVLLEHVQVLLHDGLGTPLETTVVPLSFNIVGQSTVSSVSTDYIDVEPPEAFLPVITTDPDVFEGRHFLVFDTEDKGVGIDFYQVKEGEYGSYENATSPYEIKDQSLTKKLYVRAVDKSGNEYVVALYPQNYEPWYQTMPVKTAILVVCLGIVLLLLRRWFVRRSS
jgi:hypothetical protein